ncbi:helix-turn-helix domain-containing protein [Pedosphaera parvula]|uniref:Transcriptional regulator, AraC family n=1 Tax=Pedosphaera parvula (strain Ellin514) TaxID=320771 RepID=B9XAQ1_PEDPL|nr:helix-turn-helix domain-containing protein [Pedosphaera parvula]EEF63086.1 transcriptional regulator, AraC family [Pedosphaera parvula Ellin514]
MQMTTAQHEIGTRNPFKHSSLTIDPADANTPENEAKESKSLIGTLSASKIYQDYERAFSETTGLPVALRPVESWQLPQHGKKHENPFCAMMAEKSRSCAACLRLQQELADKAQYEAQTLTCEFGLSDTAVPVRLGEKLIGFLQTGQVFRKKPTNTQFERTAQLIAEWGGEVDKDRLRQAYFDTKVVSTRQHEAIVSLLEIFAQHISLVSNWVLVQERNAEPPVIARAKRYIEDNQAEDLTLSEVAKAVNTSTFYFCKMFKKATGLHFTEYVSRVRIEKAKNLLLNPNLRVSEVAFEVGFQSLTHFNRVFKKIVGQSPTEYREQLAV